MATREENLKKINDQLESMSDEQLDEIAGGFATDPSRPKFPKFFNFIPITEQPITDKPITSPPIQPVVTPSDPIRIHVDPIFHEIDPTPKQTRTPGIFGPGIVDPIGNPQPIAKE